MSAAAVESPPALPSGLHPEWQQFAGRAPQLAATATAYLAQVGLSLSPASVRAADNALRILVTDLLAHEPQVTGFAQVTRVVIERFKTRLAARTVARTGTQVSANTIRQRLGRLRTFFDRIIEWDWTDAPARTPIFAIDLPDRRRAAAPLPRRRHRRPAAPRRQRRPRPTVPARHPPAGPHRPAGRRTLRPGRRRRRHHRTAPPGCGSRSASSTTTATSRCTRTSSNCSPPGPPAATTPAPDCCSPATAGR